MTCEDFRRITAGSASDCTGAERIGAIVHYDTCETCKSWFDTSPDRNRDTSDNRGKPTTVVIISTLLRDLEDPELFAILDKHLRDDKA